MEMGLLASPGEFSSAFFWSLLLFLFVALVQPQAGPAERAPQKTGLPDEYSKFHTFESTAQNAVEPIKNRSAAKANFGDGGTSIRDHDRGRSESRAHGIYSLSYG